VYVNRGRWPAHRLRTNRSSAQRKDAIDNGSVQVVALGAVVAKNALCPTEEAMRRAVAADT